MEQKLQYIWDENRSECPLKSNETQAVIIVDRVGKSRFIKAAIQKRSVIVGLGLAKAGYDLEKDQTFIRNLKYKDIQAEQLEPFRQYSEFSLTEDLHNLTEVQYQQARIAYGLLDANFLVIDEVFTEKLTPEDVLEVVGFIKKIQNEHDCIILPIVENPKYGKYFDHLFAYQNQTEQFLTLK